MTVEQFSPNPVQISPSAPKAETPKLEIQTGKDFQCFVALNYTYPESIPTCELAQVLGISPKTLTDSKL